MTTRLSPQEIDQIAAEWAAQRCVGLAPEEQVALDAWLAVDPRHVGAYARAEAVLAELDRVGVAGADALRMLPASAVDAGLKRRTVLVGTVAAGLAIAAGGATWLSRLLGQERYSTSIGETKEIVLSDGSLVTLNTDSQVLVSYSKAARHIRLVQGEALFDVAKNKKRPFIVTAADTQVRAVGTSFTVRLLPQQPVQVMVREGVVEIKRPQVPQAPPVRLAANTVAVAPPEAPISTEPVAQMQVTRNLAWREGRIAFDNETLANAAREFSRYSDVQIHVPAELENQTITGLFVSNDPVGFARAAAISLNLHVDVSNREVWLRREE
ncbi:MAG TPA: FecR domain-containing protein [Rhizomicrobium sp.]|nr:FecR domain-containing protein [Rhizomicrobium sp.]